jgi:Fe2+ transport system protein FeoA
MAGAAGVGLALPTDMKMKPIFNIGLDGIAEGTPVRISSLETASDEQYHLESMGLCVGRTVEVVRGGDPMIVRVLGTRIGIAAVLAAAVRIDIGYGSEPC